MNNAPYLCNNESKEGVEDIKHCDRASLVQYVKKGTIRVSRQPNGMYEYNDDVYCKAGLADNRKAVVYARVSTAK